MTPGWNTIQVVLWNKCCFESTFQPNVLHTNTPYVFNKQTKRYQDDCQGWSGKVINQDVTEDSVVILLLQKPTISAQRTTADRETWGISERFSSTFNSPLTQRQTRFLPLLLIPGKQVLQHGGVAGWQQCCPCHCTKTRLWLCMIDKSLLWLMRLEGLFVTAALTSIT